MTDKKLHVAVIFGGRSGEHEVSLMSARSVLSVLDPAKYEVTQIGITHEGKWLTGENVLGAFESGKRDGLVPFTLSPDPSDDSTGIDLFFPVLHGTFGEDGTIQGLFELADVAYVGAGVVGSSVGMDKAVFRDVMVANGIPVVETMLVLRAEIERDLPSLIDQAERLGEYPLFTKPANLGSSVGVTKCSNRSDLQEGLMEAASFDRRVLIQKGIQNAREMEVSVLGNDDPVASVCGEVLPSREFYSYESKYVDGTSGLVIPAQLPDKVSECLREYAVRAYKAIDCAGMARVDFFVEKDTNRIYLNELNSIPGFTKISMYPKLWEASGLPYSNLVDRLIELAMERKAERDRTSHSYRRDA
ncbi:MAG TPA: D-alanine--D-alanine ligase family protein [Anaerolineales bacterium]|jgi:D-alanine-D-alanine ligase|nr:D-alanine--D-alanine ligase family protein [Anaerolineales bacterium]